ncbi:hypothetical protein [Agrococcus sp. Marseille-P2731]|uniref:hypothetical protein n=1 Tax=Agrococcus sp. Marseille-P2731 TaxID=1841862 RepID=UPI000930E8EA|nr:hypothetical protein [Agrococcus sp. Marseille-P2731]
MTARQEFSFTLPPRGPQPVDVVRQVGGAAVRGRAAASLRPRLESLLAQLAEQADAVRDGATIERPWSPLTVRRDGQGLVLEVPDFDAEPLERRTTDLTTVLSIEAAWERVARAIALPAQPIRSDDTFLAVAGWQRCELLTMSRVEHPGAGDSGWFIEPHADEPGTWDPEQQEKLSAWMVQLLRPAIVRAAAAPAGIAAVIQGDDIRVLVDQADGSVRAHGLL